VGTITNYLYAIGNEKTPAYTGIPQLPAGSNVLAFVTVMVPRKDSCAAAVPKSPVKAPSRAAAAGATPAPATTAAPSPAATTPAAAAPPSPTASPAPSPASSSVESPAAPQNASQPECGTYAVQGGEDGSVSLCISAASGAVRASGSTSLQDIPGGCQVTYYLEDDTTGVPLLSTPAACQDGTGVALPKVLVLADPSSGHEYQPVLNITWNGGSAQVLGPQLTYGQQ
jgi:hypothetical protein